MQLYYSDVAMPSHQLDFDHRTMSAQAVHGEAVPQEVSAAIGRATEAAAKGGHAAVVEMLLAYLKACGEGASGA